MKNKWKIKKRKKKWQKKNNTEKRQFSQAKIYAPYHAVPSHRDSSIRKYQVRELKKICN